MWSEAQAYAFAHDWVEAWNSHNLERILTHYGENVVLTSPVAAELTGEASGSIRGKEQLRAYFARGLAAYPELRFELVNVLWGITSIVLYYANQRGTMTAEVMELDEHGHVVRVLANYSAPRDRA
jgi:hypothetical protein